MNVLITSASRKVGLVKAFQRALAEENGGQVVAVDANLCAAALYFADTHYLSPSGLGDDFYDFVCRVCQRHQVKLLIPTRDEELPFFAEKKAAFNELGVTVMVPEPEVVRICQDKRLFLEFCLLNGFSVPETYGASETFSLGDFPLFLRERSGKGSKSAFRADCWTDLESLLRRLKEPIIQEYLEAEEYTVDLFADFSGQVISVVPRQRLLVFGGESFIGKTCQDQAIMAESIRLAHVLGLTGHNTIQCFLKEGCVKFIEVNPRYGGGASLGFAAGAFTPRYLLRLVHGKEVRPEVGAFRPGLMMLRYTEDVFLTGLEGGFGCGEGR